MKHPKEYLCDRCIKPCKPTLFEGDVIYCPEFDDGIVSIWTRIGGVLKSIFSIFS